MVMSGSSVTTALAAAFMRSSARLSLGFSKSYLAHSLAAGKPGNRAAGKCRDAAVTHFVKPRPSILTTIQVLGSSVSGSSNCFTYSNLRQAG